MSKLPALYELAAEYREALETLADVELDPQAVTDTLEGLRVPLEAKAINVVKFVRSLEAVADAIDEETHRMQARSEAIRNRIDWLRRYVLAAMESTGISRVESPWFVLAVQQNPPAVIITDEALLPERFVRKEVVTRIDKIAIRKALEAGEDVPGAELSRGTRLAIR